MNPLEESTGQVSLTELNLLSPAQLGVQQYLYVTILLYCVEGKGEIVPNSIFVFVSASFTGRTWSERIQEGSLWCHSQRGQVRL